MEGKETERESILGLTSVNSMLTWDIAVNHKSIKYTNNNTRACVIGEKCTVRTPFFDKGRHIVNLKVPVLVHSGVGAISKVFNIQSGNWIGRDVHSFGTWDDVVAYHNNKMLTVTHQTKLKAGDMVTVDLDLSKQTLNWAVNGQYLSKNDIATDIPTPIAIAATLWNKGDTVQIIQYTRMHSGNYIL